LERLLRGDARVVSSTKLSALIQRGILNFAGCALARLDGKSKIDYLIGCEGRDAIRELCRTIFANPPQQWVDVRQLASQLLTTSPAPTANR
jgi:hypothetical protein